MFIGMINKVIDQVGATYLWETVGLGLFVFAVIYLSRLKKGYDIYGLNVFFAAHDVSFWGRRCAKYVTSN